MDKHKELLFIENLTRNCRKNLNKIIGTFNYKSVVPKQQQIYEFRKLNRLQIRNVLISGNFPITVFLQKTLNGDKNDHVMFG